MRRCRSLGLLLIAAVLAGCAGSPSMGPASEAPSVAVVRQPGPAIEVPQPSPPSEAEVMAAVDDESNVFFGVGETEVDDAGRQKLRQHAERLKADLKLVVALVGHTDDSGSPSYNLAIAAQRVSAVRKMLRHYGVRSSQIRRQVGGREKLAVTCRSVECRSKMRRVKLDYVD